ncbi:MAG: hypothetical protein U0869_21915 [Chloroflexota bacterium]
MKATLTWDPLHDAYALRVVAHHGDAVVPGQVRDGVLVFPGEPLPHGAEVPPALVLHGPAAQVVIRAVRDANVVDGSSVEHLRDTVQVRDRLLTLVERLADPPRLPVVDRTYPKEDG